MKVRVISTVLMTLSLGAFHAGAATAQTHDHPTTKTPADHKTHAQKEMSHDHMMMTNEPHHVLAMAYHQNLATFATALHEQSVPAGTVNVEFARAAVTEMRRSFVQMKQHHQEHMKMMTTDMHGKMSPDMHARMNEMMPKMETHQMELDKQLTALELEVQSAAPNGKQVSTLAASIHAHLEAMAKMHQECQSGQMKMK